MDLHGFSSVLARSAVRHALEELLEASRPEAAPFWSAATRDAMLDDDGSLVIITGRGRGSTNAAVLGPAVSEMLAELTPPVVARTVDGNQGRVRVDPASLQEWLDANAAS